MINFVAAAAQSSAATSGSLSPAIPTGLITGDFILAQMSGRRSGFGQPSFTAPGGWTTVSTTGDSSQGFGVAVYYRWYDASDVSYSFTATNANQGWAIELSAFRDVDDTSPLGGYFPSALSNSGTSITATTFANLEDYYPLVVGMTFSKDDNRHTAPNQPHYHPVYNGSSYSSTRSAHSMFYGTTHHAQTPGSFWDFGAVVTEALNGPDYGVGLAIPLQASLTSSFYPNWQTGSINDGYVASYLPDGTGILVTFLQLSNGATVDQGDMGDWAIVYADETGDDFSPNMYVLWAPRSGNIDPTASTYALSIPTSPSEGGFSTLGTMLTIDLPSVNGDVPPTVGVGTSSSIPITSVETVGFISYDMTSRDLMGDLTVAASTTALNHTLLTTEQWGSTYDGGYLDGSVKYLSFATPGTETGTLGIAYDGDSFVWLTVMAGPVPGPEPTAELSFITKRSSTVALFAGALEVASKVDGPVLDSRWEQITDLATVWSPTQRPALTSGNRYYVADGSTIRMIHECSLEVPQ